MNHIYIIFKKLQQDKGYKINKIKSLSNKLNM